MDYVHPFGGEPGAVEPTDLTEFLAGETKRRDGAETKLRAILEGPQTHPLIARKRLKLVAQVADRHFNLFPAPNLYVPGQGVIRHPPYAIKENGFDITGELESLIQYETDEVEEVESRKCLTCGSVLAPEHFYNYGSPSCRDCNVDGARIEEAWN
jgi:hypothetical protein